MKKAVFILLLLGAASTLSMYSQVFDSGTPLKDIVNTLGSRIRLSGYAQFGYTYDPSEEVNNAFDVKRIIFMADGKITENWGMYFMYDFKSGKMLEVYSEYKISNAFKIRLGQYKNPLTLENQLSPSSTELIDCYSLAANYMAGISPLDPLHGSHGGRDQGLMIHGDLFPTTDGFRRVSYHLAVMNGQGINVKDGNSQKDVIGALMYRPCLSVLLYASIQEGRGHAIGTSAYNPEVQKGKNYRRARWSIGGETKTSLVDFRTEYIAGRDAAVRSEGYYATANLHLTRQIDLIASYDYLNRNKSQNSRAKQTNYVGGIQYWFYPRCRVQLVYTYRDTHDDSFATGGNLVQTQVQFRF